MKRLVIILSLGMLVSGSSLVQAAADPFGDGTVTIVPSGKIKPPRVVTASDDKPPSPPSAPPNAQAVKPPERKSDSPAKPEKKDSEPSRKFRTHKVVDNDCLWDLARKYLGDGARFPEIVELNKKKYPSLVKNPELIRNDWILAIPVDAKTGGGASGEPKGDNKEQPKTNGGVTTGDKKQTPPDKTLSDDQKVARLQDALNAYNAKAKGKKITALNEDTIRILIDEGFIRGDREWIALNPPLGFRYVLENGKVKLVKSQDKPITTGKQKTLDERLNEPLLGGKKGDKAKPEVKPQPKPEVKPEPKPQPKPEVKPEPKPAEPKPEDKPKVDEKKALSSAEKNFNGDISAAGIPNLIDREKDYTAAMEALSSLLPGKLMTRDFNNSDGDGEYKNKYLDYYNNTCVLQKNLKAAHQLYEKKIQERDTDRFLGIFGNNIESAGKKVAEAREELKKNWSELRSLYTEAKTKVDAAQSEKSKLESRITAAEDQFAKVRDNPDNAKEAQKLAEEIEESKSKVKDLNKIISEFGAVKKVFK